MSRYAAFLRGMNVGGHRLKNDELRSLFEALGLDDVATFRASGNVIFTAAEEPVGKLTSQIEEGLEAALGYAVPTFLRTAGAVLGLAAHEPFPRKEVAAAAGKLQVMLLLEQPTAQLREKTLALATEQDRLAFGERELYWLPSGGILDSPLDLKAIGVLLGPTTVRTKGTIELIAEKHFAS
jgi:uncharacterized protein (DUF1697 family)